MKKQTTSTGKVFSKCITENGNTKNATEIHNSLSVSETIPTYIWIHLGIMGINLQIAS